MSTLLHRDTNAARNIHPIASFMQKTTTYVQVDSKDLEQTPNHPYRKHMLIVRNTQANFCTRGMTIPLTSETGDTVLLVTTALAKTVLYPTAKGEGSYCFDCPVEGKHCFLFNLVEQECLMESNGNTIMDSCTSQDTYFNHKDNGFYTKLEFIRKCKIDLGNIIPGSSKDGPVCETEDFVTSCVYFLDDHDAPPTANGGSLSSDSTSVSSAAMIFI
ncbi:hypothetical protein INT47_008232 [Mucor saturninus]|uniref:Uncharacterized protein n=1 Tax=Mucor saturninus TaxID=64648 RepID=A0A8H7R4N4_9FUNG|nr:hypothetical protein INT47_008232 [Mucor saturninus]